MDRLLKKIGGGGAAAIFVAALAYRALYFLTVRGDPLLAFVEAIPDSSLFHNWAVALLAGGDGGGAYFIGPAYAFFLAGLYAVMGVKLYGVIFVQFVMGAATASVLYVTSRRLFGSAAAWVSGLLWAFYLPAVFFETQILPVTLTLFLIAVTLALLIRGLDGTRRWWAWTAAAGVVFSAATLARPNLLLFVPVIALWPLIRKGRAWRVAVTFAAAAALGAGVTAIRNKIVADEWVAISSQGGLNFYIGNGPYARGSYTPPPDAFGRPEVLNDEYMRSAPSRALGHAASSSESSAWWFKRTGVFMARNVGATALLYGKKLSLLVNSYEVTLNADYNMRALFSPFHRVPVPYFGVLFAFGMLGLLYGRVGGHAGVNLLLIYLGSAAASVLLFFVVDSYRIVLAPPLAAGAGYGAVIVVGDWRNRRWGAAAAGTSALAAAVAFSWLPGVGVDRDAIATQSYTNYGSYYLLEGDYERAAGYYRRALKAKADNPYAMSYLGRAYEKQGRPDLARYYYIESLKLDADDEETNFYLGSSLARDDRPALAIPFLEIAAASWRANADAWWLLAECRARTGQYREAADAYGKYLRLAPGDATGHARYGTILMETGDYDAGVNEVRLALRLNPRVPGAHLLLGKYALMHGRDGDASREFVAELEVNPSSEEARALLARTDAQPRAFDNP